MVNIDDWKSLQKTLINCTQSERYLFKPMYFPLKCVVSSVGGRRYYEARDLKQRSKRFSEMFRRLFGGGFKFLTTKDWRKNFLSTVTFPSSLLIKFTKSKEIYHTLASLSTTSSIIVVKSSVDTFLKTNHILNYNSMSCYFPHPQKTIFTASSSFHISYQNVFMTGQQCERDDHLPKI